MPDYPRKGSSDRTQRSHGEQIRRIRTRIPPEQAYSIYQFTQDDLYYDEAASAGWFIEGLPYPHLMRQGNLVHLFGLLRWEKPTGAYAPVPYRVVKLAGIPSEFLPQGMRRLLGHGHGRTDDRLWVVYLQETAGTFLELATYHSGSATNPWGDLTDAGSQIVSLSATYAIDPEAETYPA